jgi:membrane peptidoglycan carboxypeptidase
VFSAIAGLLGFSVLSGLLVTVMVAPAVAVTGITASSAIGVFDSLPEYMVIGQQPERNEIWATYSGPGNVNGQKLIATIYDQNRQEVSYDAISAFAREAVVDGEDRRFFEHGGVDVSSVVRASIGNAIGTSASGASTLSMQLVKNIYVQQALQLPTEKDRQQAYKDATATTLDRKLKEMKLAIGLEKKYTKKEILTAYLNIAFFGDNTYGIQAAAQRYYSVDAKDLTLPQAASLIAIVQYPNVRGLFDPANYVANKDRRDVILDAMLDVGDITQKEHDEAIATPVDDTTLKPSTPANGCIGADPSATWFCDYVVKNVKNFAFLGDTEQQRADNWRKGGYKLYTTLDMDIQVNAQNQTWAYADNKATDLALGSATVGIQPGTGRVLMMTQNMVFNDTLDGGGPGTAAVNYSTSFSYGGSTGFQSGSTYKLFTLLNWLEAGKGLYARVSGDQRTENQAKFKNTCTDEGPFGGPYPFKNDSGGNPGTLDILAATAGSVNGAFISMGLQLDQCVTRHIAESLGVQRGDETHLQSNPSAILGTNEVTPLSMAGAYAAVAAGGKFCKPIIVDKVVLPDGTEQPGQVPDCQQAIPSDIAAAADYALAGVTNGGTGSRSNPDDGVPLIGKTGTTDSATDTWVITSTTNVTTAVWVGNSIGKVSLSSYDWQGFAGNLLRHEIMRNTVAVTNAKYGGGSFPDPPAALLTGSGINVPDVKGQTPEAAKQLLEALGFTYLDGGPVDSEIPAGKVAGTDPAAGAQSGAGAVITVFTSKGNKVALPDESGKTSADAHSDLAAKGFTSVSDSCVVLTSTTPVVPGSTPAPVAPTDPRIGTVQTMDPAAGTLVVPTSPVTLGIGKATCP